MLLLLIIVTFVFIFSSCFACRFALRKTNMLTFSDKGQALSFIYYTLKARSDGTEFAGMHKNFLANRANHGYCSVSDCLSSMSIGL